MTEPRNQLSDLLDRSTDRIESPDLVGQALAGARRRRTTRRAVVASAAAIALISGVAVAGALVDGDGRSTGPVTPPSPTETVTEQVAQPTFDPANVDDLPAAPEDLAPTLPDVIEPPAVVPWLADDPIDSAVLAFWGEDAVSLMSPEGDWRSVPIERVGGGAELSTDGTRLAVATDTGADIWDLPTGEVTTVDRPAGFPVTTENHGWWQWVDGSTLLLDDPQPGAGGWVVDVATGEATSVPYPISGIYTVADGAVVEVPEEERLVSIKADGERVAGIRDLTVVLADRADLTPVAELPFVDEEASFADGKMPVVALLGDGTVLLQVPLLGGEPGDWCVAAWSPASGDLSRVTCGDTGGVPASYAEGLLG